MIAQPDQRVGNVIGGKWRVDGVLGTGSMAAVYAVTHRNGARAALKILHPTLCTDAAICERFLGEGYLTNSVKHPGIVRVLDDGMTDDGCVFLVMDLLEGMTLEALRQARGGRIPLPEILAIADRLMDVIHAVHVAGIIHRDLKPQNVFICDDGVVKLLDFGVARVFDQNAQSKLSMFGLVLGTPSFMSPEQALGARDRVDHRTDIWSLGATLFTAITGQTVHLGPNIQAKLLAAASVKARSIALAKHDLPPAIAAAIDTSLRFKKEERWQSVDAFRRALREAADGLGLVETAYAPPIDHDRTRIDDGARQGGVVVRAERASTPPPPPHPAMTLPGTGTIRNVPSLGAAIEEEPPGSFDAGPGGTFIGVATVEDGIPAIAMPPSPTTERLRPAIPPASPKSSRPEVDDLDAFRAPRTPRFDHPGALSAAEGSYPAASSTLLRDDIDEPRRSSAGVWVAAFLLVAAAVGGAGFFAINRANAEGSQKVTPAPPPVETAAPLVHDPPSPTNVVISLQAAPDAGLVPRAPAPRTTSASPTSARGTRSRSPSSPNPPSDNPVRASSTDTAPTPPPTLAPDPFGTPE